MKTEWIKVSKAVPPFTHIEHYDDEECPDDFESDLVLCLTNEGDIIQGYYWQEQGATSIEIDHNCGFFIDPNLQAGINGELDVVAWIPIKDAYPEWFIKEEAE